MKAFGSGGLIGCQACVEKLTGIFSVLPSLPTSSLFLAVMCFCLPLGQKTQCKMVLEMLGLPLSVSPYPKAAGPRPQHTSSTVLLGPSNLLVFPAQQLCTAGEDVACYYRARRAGSPLWVFFSSAPTNEAVLIGAE